jgi:DNA-binding NarL/FixJ family response regulator
VRIVIAEDSGVIRAGLVDLLTDRGHEVAAAVADGDALRAAVARHHPDVMVVDVRLPPTFTNEGVRAAIELRRAYPGLGVLVFSQYIETRYASELLADSSTTGAAGVGYLLKDRVGEVSEFIDALNRVAVGGTVLDPEVVKHLLDSRSCGRAELTAREREVLELMAEGRSNSAIAELLVVTERSVEKHVGKIFNKLDLSPSQDDNRRVLAVLRYLEPDRGGGSRTGRPSAALCREPRGISPV